MIDTPTVCPPHHWEITLLRTTETAYHHHTCVRCGETKDVPVAAAFQTKSTWRIHDKKR